MSDKKLVEFEGVCLYAYVHPGQERGPHPDALAKKTAHESDRSYSITVECSATLHKKLLKLGISPMQTLKDRDVFKEKDLGVVGDKTFITIRGTNTKTYVDKTTGELIKTRFADPKVVDANTGLSLDSGTLIGDGSQVKVTAELASTGASRKVLRLTKVEVQKLVPYVKSEDTGEVILSEADKTAEAPTAASMF